MSRIFSFSLKKYSGKLVKEKLILVTSLSLCFAMYLFFNEKRLNRLRLELGKTGRYTIGITAGSYDNIKGTRTIDYRFSVNGKLYKNWKSYPSFKNDVIVNNGRYFVTFAKDNPDNAEILFKSPVPDTVKNAPDNGWLAAPVDYIK